MASELTLEINGRKRDILRYNYRFHREIRYNRPVDSIWGGEICVEMTSDGDTYFLEMLMAEKRWLKRAPIVQERLLLFLLPYPGKYSLSRKMKYSGNYHSKKHM